MIELLGFLLLFVIAAIFPFWLLFKEIKKRGIQKSITFAPQPLRNLTEEEKSWLQTRIQEAQKNKIPFFVSLILLIGIFFLIVSMVNLLPFAIIFFLCLLLAFDFIFCGACVIGFIQSLNYAKDLKEKIFKVQGKVFKERGPTGRGAAPWRYLITVGKVELELNSTNKSEVDFYDNLNQGDEILIEYSLHSKHIWSIKKV